MKKVWKTICWILAIVITLVVLVAGYVCIDGYFLYKKAVDEISVSDKIAQVRSHEDYVPYSEISKDFLTAVVAVEDKRFYTHSGFDIISTTRAIVTNLILGELVEGGSTITQQLSKNLYFSMDQQFNRKVAEVIVAMDLERLCTKEEILELYVNVIYFGNNCYGIRQAANYYYGKTPDRLTLDESSLLAGLPKAPSSYANDKEKQYARQADVLDAMVNYGAISKEDAQSIISKQGK